jgi:hypothetical protein
VGNQGYSIGAANGVAENGAIAAFGGTPSGAIHALLLTPEPR